MRNGRGSFISPVAIHLIFAGLWLAGFPLVCRGDQATATVERWGVFELTLAGPSTGNPYLDVQWSATFSQGGRSIKVPGFWDSGGTYTLRFSPPATGQWSYLTGSTAPELDGKSGTIQVTEGGGEPRADPGLQDLLPAVRGWDSLSSVRNDLLCVGAPARFDTGADAENTRRRTVQ